jgi:hypothetical protein
MKRLWRISCVAVIVALPFSLAATNAHAQRLYAAPEQVSFTTEVVGKRLTCRRATSRDTLALAKRDTNKLQVITPVKHLNPNGLTIVLRATPQLDSFPEAKAAFLAAAARWESLIKTRITIVIDVDFGPTFFGLPFGENVLGATYTQNLLGPGVYDLVRLSLFFGSSNLPELMLYSRFPAGKVRTDIGSTDIIFSPSATFRALGLMSATANPTVEMASFGPPPAIAFNSNFSFDFNPSDGIDADKLDFDGIATHEIGHALGFASNVGFSELLPGFPATPTVLDLFRFRPNVTLFTFSNGARILSSGGDQVFYSLNSEIPLSTGRPNGTGGDGAQASHWKFIADPQQPPIGIMEPFISFGQRRVITDNDLRAFNTIGYRLSSE